VTRGLSNLYYFVDRFFETLSALMTMALLGPLILLVLCLLIGKFRPLSGTLFLGALALTTTAVVVGYMAGASRLGVMGQILPILLSGVGIVASYAVLDKRLSIGLAASGVIVFVVHTLLGALYGSYDRELGLVELHISDGGDLEEFPQ